MESTFFEEKKEKIKILLDENRLCYYNGTAISIVIIGFYAKLFRKGSFAFSDP